MPNDPAVGLAAAISRFGEQAKRKLSNPGATGEPEDQLRAPLEELIGSLAELCRISSSAVAAVGEASLADLKTRPDYAVTVRNALTGFIEVKAPGKGADPRRFRDPHDKEQWSKLRAIPNLMYTDGNQFGLWRNGELVAEVVRLEGDIATSGRALAAPIGLLTIFEDFLRWQPLAPRSVKDLAKTAAQLCRLLRDEVIEQLARRSPALTALAEDWRRLLFPDATDKTFADGYAQAVTFGLLMARARGIPLGGGLEGVARQLTTTDSLIGTALKLLTDSAENQRTLQTSLGTLIRVLDAVSWGVISRGDPEAWLYFYEDFLEVYDNALRKQTGSYYTPPQVVDAMVRLVDEALRSRFGLARGVAATNVTIADPAVGTGTFLLGVLRRIAETIESEEGPGAVPAAVTAKLRQLIAFELQLGPFAVAQLRLVAELTDLTGAPPTEPIRMYVTDTLANPYVEQEYMPEMLRPIAESRRRANQIKREERITVVIGNPPYKEKAKGRGGWVESGAEDVAEAPLLAWMPPRSWRVGAHAKHLRNLYVYFWRWATWKVFDQNPESNHGVVAFITVAGFLNGPGFEKMRDYLRRTGDEIWIIDCSPEGHQPEVSSRIFQGVQQPICIMVVARTGRTVAEVPARVRFRALPAGHREEKFAALVSLTLDEPGWEECSTNWRASFRPAATGAWATYPAIENLFTYHGSGVMPGRTWIIAPDQDSLEKRWNTLQQAPTDRKETLFHPHLRSGRPGDRHVNKAGQGSLYGQPERQTSVAADQGEVVQPVRYGFRSFDRQWIVPDNRLINQPNPTLWKAHSKKQVYLTALSRESPTSGPAITVTGLVPDLHHYKGSFGGRAYPLWSDAAGRIPNLSPAILGALYTRFGADASPESIVAYVAAIAAHPGFIGRFASDLQQPGLRIPITSDKELFREAVALGLKVVWLHTYGERFTDPSAGRPASAPRLPPAEAPRLPAHGGIPLTAEAMPDELKYDPATNRLHVGVGIIERVTPEMWGYEVSGKQVIHHWFSYRKKDRERPILGDRRPPSPLGEIQPDHWLAEYTTDLIDLLHVIGRLVKLESAQAALLGRVCAGPTITAAELLAATPPPETATPVRRGRKRKASEQPDFL